MRSRHRRVGLGGGAGWAHGGGAQGDGGLAHDGGAQGGGVGGGGRAPSFRACDASRLGLSGPSCRVRALEAVHSVSTDDPMLNCVR